MTESMRDAQHSRWVRGLSLIVVGVLLLIAIVLGAYILNFWGAPSADPGDWGVFGDYVGGTLNAVLAFFSFGALLLTLYLQGIELRNSTVALKASATELRQSREIAAAEAKRRADDLVRADLFKIIHLVHTELELIFARRAEFSPTGQSMGHYFSSSAPSAGEGHIPFNGDVLTPNDRTSILEVFERISELDTYLNQYEATFGTSAVTYYFRRRYMTARQRLVAKRFAVDEMWVGFRSPGFGWSALAPAQQECAGRL